MVEKKWYHSVTVRLMLALAVVILAILVLATKAEPVIGLYEDEMATDCAIPLEIYTPKLLYVAATWDTGELESGVTAAEFALSGLPSNDGYPIGTVTVTSIGTDLVIGNIWTDYSIAWSSPQGAEKHWFVIATISILPFAENWIDTDQNVTAVVGDDCNCLVLVNGIFESVQAYGETSYLNASQEWFCNYTMVTESSWSDVKALY